MPQPDKFEQKAQEVEALEAEAPKLFNPAALVESSKKIHEATFPLLGKIRTENSPSTTPLSFPNARMMKTKRAWQLI
jgi:hypothetical protein